MIQVIYYFKVVISNETTKMQETEGMYLKSNVK